jgi:hypothetical protein
MNALSYYTPAQEIGPWIGWLRRGFDSFVTKSYLHSINQYVYAGELGYEVAQANAAFILRRQRRHLVSHPRALELRELLLSANHGNQNSFIHIGNYHLSIALEKSISQQQRLEMYKSAIRWYTKASNAGSALSSFYLGLTHHYGHELVPVNLERAARYYSYALNSEKSLEYEIRWLVNALLLLIQLEERYAIVSYLNQRIGLYAKSYLGYQLQTAIK